MVDAALGAVAVALSFVVLGARRPGPVLAAYAAQAMTIAAAAAWQAWVQGSAQLAVGAVLMIVLKGVVLPMLLRPRLGVSPAARWPVAAGAALVVLAVASVSEALAPALSVVALGGLAIVVRRGAWRGMGLLTLESGVALAVVGVPGLPLPLLMASAAVAVGAVPQRRVA